METQSGFGPIIKITPGGRNLIVLCEHASARIPAHLDHLGLPPEVRRAHIAWDPGALLVARGLARLLDAHLVEARISRLVYDLNRPPHAPSAMAAKSEVHDIPGNRDLSQAERQARTASIYLPFHAKVCALIARLCATGSAPALVTVHSFTPVYFRKPRDVAFGIIHDTDDRLAKAILARAPGGLDSRLNQPYSATDGVVHTLQLHATPCQLPHAMLEIRNDLIATPAAAVQMATRLAPVINASLSDITK